MRLDGCFLCYSMEDMIKDLPPVAPSPCTQNGYITFGSFNQIGKVQKECVDLWCRVLKEDIIQGLGMKA